MGNTNFQTIHQMGTAISDFVKQATGRDNLQNVVMDHVTVAQNHRYEEVDLSGQVVSFQAGEAGLTFEKLNVQIKPVQDLHGYDSPWPAGGGSNIWDEEWVVGTITGTGQYISSGDRVVSKNFIPVSPGETYYAINIAWVYFYASDTVESKISNISPNPTFTVPSDAHFVKFYTAQSYGTVYKNDVAINYPATVTTYAPYSNICPITGWTMVNLYQAGYNMEDARVYRFTLPSEAGVMYGGSLTVNDDGTGTLVVDRIEWTAPKTGWATYQYSGINKIRYHSLPSETIDIVLNAPANRPYSVSDTFQYYTDPANWFSEMPEFMYVYNVSGVSGSKRVWIRYQGDNFEDIIEGAKFIFMLQTPITYTLTASQVQTILGQNYIWADTGDIEVKFTNVKEMY